VHYADFQGLCSADMYPINVSRDHIFPGFASLMLLSEPFTKYANRLSGRARMPKLNRHQLFAWEAPCPSIEKQQEIVSGFRKKAEKTVNLVSSIKDQFSTINALPGALLRQAFRGEL
jgi:type I restriction enzyme S subunit